MRIIDCIWEKENLGKNVVEIIIEGKDLFDRNQIIAQTEYYDYAVIKVPMNKTDFNFGLSSMGFTVIETQMNISKKYKLFPFEDRLVRQVYPFADMEYISSIQDFEDVYSKITPDMFSTDRIYLDSYFSRDASCRRYKKWIKTEFEEGTSDLVKLCFKGQDVGFAMLRTQADGTKLGLLGGIFEEHQNNGLGLMTAGISFIHAHKVKKPFKVMRTAISSNNIPMMQFYNYLNFKIDSMTYVFVKHNME